MKNVGRALGLIWVVRVWIRELNVDEVDRGLDN
jgi:hypothetical protein